jgi:hypothetical protein
MRPTHVKYWVGVKYRVVMIPFAQGLILIRH